MESTIHIRPLLFFYANTAITLLAANMSRYSVILFTRTTTGSDSFTGFVFAVSFIPTILLGPYAGVVADKYDRRRTVVYSQLLITAAVIVFALGFNGPESIYWNGFSVIYAFLIGAAVTFMIPARFALLGNLVPPKDIVKSSSVVQLIVLAGFGLAPFATGLLKDVLSWHAFFFASAAFYFVGILFLIPVKTTYPSLHFKDKTTLAEGIRFTSRTRSVRDLLIIACIGIFLLGPVQVVLPFYAKSHYGLSESGRGAFVSLLGLGLLLGGLSVRLLPVPRRRGFAAAVAGMVSGLAAVFLVLTDNVIFGGLMLFGAGASGGTLATLVSSGLQSHTPDHFRGRVMSLYSIITQLIPAISGLIVAQISHVGGPISAFFVSGSFVALASIAALYLPGIQSENEPDTNDPATGRPTKDGRRTSSVGVSVMKKKWLIAGLAVLALAVVWVTTERSVRMRATALPDNAPSICRPGFADGKRVVVAMGDSITHGRVSSNYVDRLSADPRNAGLFFINAGINSELAWNALQRVDAVEACKPAYVTVLIGTNDVNAKFSVKDEDRYIKTMHLPERPTKDWYATNLDALVRKLKTQQGVKIALMSLPPIGENLESAPNLLVREYNGIIAATAKKHNVIYLPLFETMGTALRGKTANNYCLNSSHPMEVAAARHFLLGQSWNQAAHANGFHLLTDCLHLSDDGAAIVADLIQGFLR